MGFRKLLDYCFFLTFVSGYLAFAQFLFVASCDYETTSFIYLFLSEEMNSKNYSKHQEYKKQNIIVRQYPEF